MKLDKDINKRKEELEYEIKEVTTKHNDFKRDSASFLDRMQKRSKILQSRVGNLHPISKKLRRGGKRSGKSDPQAGKADKGSGDKGGTD